MNPPITRNVFSLVFLLSSFFASAQKLSTGTYTGLEVITVTPDKTAYWPGVYNFGPRPYDFGREADNSEEKWFHEVSILVTDSSLAITKKPVKIKDGIKSYSDSTGGFYSYKGYLFKVNDTTFNIRGELKNCTYCPHSATGTPRYVNTFYTIRPCNNNWKIDTPFEKGLLFRKE